MAILLAEFGILFVTISEHQHERVRYVWRPRGDASGIIAAIGGTLQAGYGHNDQDVDK